MNSSCGETTSNFGRYVEGVARQSCECASPFTAEQVLPLGVQRRAIRNDVLETNELVRHSTEFYDCELRAVTEAEHRDGETTVSGASEIGNGEINSF